MTKEQKALASVEKRKRVLTSRNKITKPSNTSPLDVKAFDWNIFEIVEQNIDMHNEMYMKILQEQIMVDASFAIHHSLKEAGLCKSLTNEVDNQARIFNERRH